MFDSKVVFVKTKNLILNEQLLNKTHPFLFNFRHRFFFLSFVFVLTNQYI